MVDLNIWAARHGVTPAALAELRGLLTAPAYDPPPIPGESEAAVLVRVRLEASAGGGVLWRNNVGAVCDPCGGFLRYGLANDSRQLNERLKSSDLIGLRPVVITPQHVGGVIGQFVAREVKAGSWRYAATPRERAQLRFLETVIALGGDACFACGTGTI